jgi:hypothetical protein
LPVHGILLFAFGLSLVPYSREKRSLLPLVGAFLFLFLAIRYQYGNDYDGYRRLFVEYSSSGPHFRILEEPVFVWLNSVLPSYFSLVAVTSAIYIATMYRAILRWVPKDLYWVAVLFWLLNPNLLLIHLSAVRQSLAIGLLLEAFAAKLKHNRITFKVVLLCVLAAGLHISSILVVPVFMLISKKPPTKKWLFVVTIGTIVFTIPAVFETVIYSVEPYIPFWYSSYLNLIQRNSLASLLVNLSLFVAFILGRKYFLGNDIMFWKLSFIATAINTAAFNFGMLARIGMYFQVFYLFSIPVIAKESYRKRRHYFFLFYFIIVYLARYYRFMTSDLYGPHYRVYQTFLTQFID